MVQKSITINKKGERALNRLIELDGPKTLDLLYRYFSREAQYIAGQIVKTKLSGKPVGRRTGTLARSVIGQAERLNGLPAFRVGVLRGPALSYAATLEYGATIRPKNARALAIPMNEATTPAGVDKFGGPRGYPGELRFLPFRRGGIAVGKLVDELDARTFESQGISPYQLDALYLLVKKVVIKPRFYLRDGVKEQLPTFLKRMSQFLAGALIDAKST